MSKFCCDRMEYRALYDKTVIDYDESTRSYTLILYKSDTGSLLPIYYCPWCGTKLPKELNEEWGDILEKEYRIKDPGFEDGEPVPLEFRTDEWWKKRGL